ncbi:MAG: sulfurtransferase TusA family protein [Chloroflexi bacterium]|nr:sulfurtransferase TusA family protein [Chloroflexota bacterium]MBV9897410.1 sulfurtransferase TusA family protein [Chloroflexota bacterium]
MSKQLDVRGEICPYPMMKASEALKNLSSGESLQVLTDHAPALSTIPWEAAKQGYRASIERVGSPEWLITLEPAEGRSQAELVADLGQQLEAVGALDD